MAYISTEEVKEIRKALKEKFGKDFKFSVQRHHHSSVNVSIMASPVDFSDLFKSDYDKEHQHVQINHHWTENLGEHAELFDQIVEIIRTAPGKAVGGQEWFDKSDSMTDYFHTAFYFNISVGQWDKPYQQISGIKKAA
ncbi:MAG: LPD29 domain-containing protein [Desulfuromonadales bacterium]|uniref:LPD29 domain-containing protein n=1 Tax=Desulfuromonas sp. AOP6 TaxID=1566351 RepID=UPI00126E4135|nr:LPD29 domain-containing protein [Desulfuromonas sp. AOP6]MDW7644080.1 LPD29 domain-containing protein [Desulfuromonadales bacterium]MDW7757284.1 LPD29 domain-containing protein [Desulfuromonadales bacterium]BCA80311.1 hypothetical protein AOP6_2098 [Desulfuromonas sp. AOP6]